MGSRNGLFALAAIIATVFPPFSPAQTGGDTVTFKSGVNAVTVPVVVRDASGRVVTDLRKEDFTLLDNGAPVTITSFQLEKPGQRIAEVKDVSGGADSGQAAKATSAKMVIPDHFIAFFFDDMSIQEFGDLVWVRDAAMRRMEKLQPGDRAAIFTTSCLTQLDFTDDRDKLRSTVAKLQFRPPRSVCAGARSQPPQNLPGGAAVPTADDSAQYALLGCMGTVFRRMAILPGQRTIIYVSYGMALDPRNLNLIADQAVRSKVVVNTLNARGLHPTMPGADFSMAGIANPQQLEIAIQGMAMNELAQGLGLSAIAYATGGTAIENTNDADGAYRRLGTPDATYMLGFSPADATLDGKMHHLKVTLNGARKVTIQARASYFAATLQQRQAMQARLTTPVMTESRDESKEIAESLGVTPERPSPARAVTFKAGTNLVLVPVVVRDAQGHAIGNLTKDNFELRDRGKIQEIKQFAVETPGHQVALDRSVENDEAPVNPDEIGALQKHETAPMVIPDRFVALVFDDYHLPGGAVEYLDWARDAARRYIATLRPSDRVALYTTYGVNLLDFTSDRAALDKALLKLRPGPATNNLPETPSGLQMPVMNLREQGWAEARSMEKLDAVVRRMAISPGQRTLVFLSPGFAIRDEQGEKPWSLLPDTMALIDRAIRSDVVINTLNVHGLAIEGNGSDELLFRLADGTGGTYVRDRNDYDSALRQAAAAPEYRYILAFSPENLKQDGSTHELKVTLKGVRGFEVQARRAYWDAKPGQALAAGGNVKPQSAAPVESKTEANDLAQQLGVAAAPPSKQPPLQLAKSDVPSPLEKKPEEAATFKAKVNLVTVPVVVRDVQGHAIGNLTKDDFQVFDKGKKQEITKFTLEKASGEAVKATPAPASTEVAVEGEPAAPTNVPDNFVAYLFDDVHLKLGDLAYVRDAAGRNIDALPPNSRAAIFTTSGQGAQDFTDDRTKLHEALLKLRQRPITGSGIHECPDVSYYMADLIVNKNDPQAFQAAVLETLGCAHLDPQTQMDLARSMAKSAAQRALVDGDHESHVTLISIKEIVRRMAGAPGRRNIILISPGFTFSDDQRFDELDAVERAVRSNVVISSLDARGLYTLTPGGDIDAAQYDPVATQMKDQYKHQDAMMASGVLAEMAYGTGGTFVQNTNDMDGAFRSLGSAPEYVYMLGFEPANLKPDGNYHALKVKVNGDSKFTVQARHGYFAPKGAESETAAAREEIDSAVFSREEIHELPVELHTQFFKPTDDSAKLKVLASVDLKSLLFRKDEGRNLNNLTVVSALFDNNGNFVQGWQKVLEMRLLDTTMQRIRTAAPIKVTTSFDVKPGSYLIRLVVRDSEGHLMATENGAVEIP